MKPMLAVVAAIALAVPPAARCQAGTSVPGARDIPGSSRAMALGGAYAMSSGHADAVFYHPALLSGSSGFGLEMQRWGGASSSLAASAAVGWFGGGVGIGLQTLQHPGGGAVTEGVGQDALFRDGDGTVTDRVAALGYARRMFGVRLGVVGKLVDRHADGVESSGVLADVGAASRAGPFTLGLTLQDLGDDPLDGDDGFGVGRVALGAGAYGRQVGIFDLGVAGSLVYDGDETWAGAGVELGYWPISGRTFVARVGVQNVPDGSAAGPLTLGFAFWGDDLVLEWAFRDFGDLDEGTHRFGVRWR